MSAPIELEPRNVSKARRDKIIAAQDGVCKRAHCEAPAIDVDHIIPLWAGGTNKDHNLEGLCPDCHKRKTKAEASARARAKRRHLKHTGQAPRTKRPIPQRPDGGWPPKGSRKLAGYGGRKAGMNQKDETQ